MEGESPVNEVCVCGRVRKKIDNNVNWQRHVDACQHKLLETEKKRKHGLTMYFQPKKKKLEEKEQEGSSTDSISSIREVIAENVTDDTILQNKDVMPSSSTSSLSASNFTPNTTQEIGQERSSTDSSTREVIIDDATDDTILQNKDVMSSSPASNFTPIATQENDQLGTPSVRSGENQSDITEEGNTLTLADSNNSINQIITETGANNGGDETCDPIFPDNNPANLKNFRQNLSPELLDAILRMGPCQPTEEEMPGRQFPKDSQGRSFHSSWYDRKLVDGSFGKRTWLSYSKTENQIYCLDCMFFAKNATSQTWISIGYKLWKNGTIAISNHETSNVHIKANLLHNIRRMSSPLVPSLTSAKKMQILQNREVVRQLIDITIFLARHCLAFRGHTEKWSDSQRGNFKDLVVMVGKHSPSMAAYIQPLMNRSKKPEYSLVSWRRQNQLIHAISMFIKEKFCQELRNAKFFSISVDSTFDLSKKEQVSFIVRYVSEETGDIYERLLAVKESPSTTGQDLANLFNEVCTENELEWKSDLVGQSHDGASNMRSQYKSLQALIKQSNPKATYIWCWAHRLNLVVVSAVGSSTDAMNMFGNLEKTYSFISASKRRVNLFEDNQKKRYSNKPKFQIRRVKRVNTTRWMSHSYALQTVLITFEALIDTLEDIRDSDGPGDNEAGALASGLIIYFTSEVFVITAHLFLEIFKIIDPLTKTFQSPDFDLLSAMNMLKTYFKELQELRDNFDKIIEDSKKFMEEAETEFTMIKRNVRKRYVKIMPGEKARDEPITDPIKAFRVKTFYAAIEVATEQIQERFFDSTGENSTALGILEDFCLLSRKRIDEVRENKSKFPEDAFSNFCDVYSFVDMKELQKDYLAFSSSFHELDEVQSLPKHLHGNSQENEADLELNESDIENNENSDQDSDNNDEEESSKKKNEKNINSGSIREIFKIFCRSKLQVTFPHLHALLKIAVTLPITSTSTERAFSKLKRVKTDLRTTMGDERLEGLLIIASEKDIEIDYDKIIDKFARNSTLLTRDLIC